MSYNRKTNQLLVRKTKKAVLASKRKQLVSRIAELIRSFDVRIKISETVTIRATVSWQSDTTVDIESIDLVSLSWTRWNKPMPLYDRIFHSLADGFVNGSDLDPKTCDAIRATPEIKAVHDKIKKLCEDCDNYAYANNQDDPSNSFEDLLDEAHKMNEKKGYK